MTSTGYLENKPRPAAIIAVVAIHAAGIGALLMIAPTVVDHVKRKPLIGEMIKLPPDPPEVEDRAKEKTKTPLQADRPERRVETRPTGGETGLANDPGPLTGTGSGEGPGGIDIIQIDPVRDPVIVGPQFTGRNPQPPYPPAMQRMNIEGAVTVRVLVGVDGRPVRIEAVKIDQDAFFTTTRDWAMKNWRFKPATRDGEPFQEWRTMTVRFEMN